MSGDLKDRLGRLSKAELVELARATAAVERRVASTGPRNDEELHAWIRANLGIDVPRVVVVPGNNSPFEFLADMFFERETAALVLGSRGSGKCIAGGTMLHEVSSGRMVAVEDLHTLDDPYLLSYDEETGVLVPTRVNAVAEIGPEACIRIATESGNVLLGTTDHPVLTSTGWKPLSKVRVGETIACAGWAPTPFQPARYPWYTVALCALFQGSRTGRASIELKDPWLRELLEDIAFALESPFTREGDTYTFPETSLVARQVRHYCRTPGARNYRFPTLPMRLGRSHLRIWLTTFLMTAMEVDENGEASWWDARRSVPYALKNLLARLGVPARVSRWKGGYRLDFSPYGRKRLMEELPLWGAPRTTMRLYQELEKVSVEGLVPTKDVRIPLALAGVRLPKSAAYVEPDRIGRLADQLGADWPLLTMLRSKDIWWEKVTHRKYMGRRPMYDIAMEGTHNFVASGILSHNTFLVALLHYLNGRWKPGIEGFTFGATEAQSKRCYQHLKNLLRDGGDEHNVENTLESKTIWKNGSSLEVVPGTVRAVNGPHPQVVHADEVDQLDPQEVWWESRNMAVAKITKDGRVYPAQNIATSTRKSGVGLMQLLITEIEEAVRLGRRPNYKLYAWSIFEISQQVPNCQIGNPMVAAGQCEGCDCHEIIKGSWDDGEPRTLKDVCRGRFYKSRGFQPFDTIKTLFKENSREVWEAQQENLKPERTGLVLPQFDRSRHGIRRFQIDPANGPIYCSIDWGGTNPFAVEWFQVLKYEVHATNYDGNKVVLPEGSHVFFDEIYMAELSNSQLATRVIEREQLWKQHVPGWRVALRFSDPQGRSARIEFANRGMTCVFYCSRDVKEHIKVAAELVGDGRMFVDVERCPMFLEEIEAWHYPRKRMASVDDPEKPVEDFDHAMSAMRYGVANVHMIHLRGMTNGRINPAASPNGHATSAFVQDVRKSLDTGFSRRSSATRLFPGEQWRAKLGRLPEG